MKKGIKRSVLAVAVSCIVSISSMASAMTTEEAAAIQKAGEAFLSNAPADSYHITAEKLLERMRSGKKDFVIYDVRTGREKTYDKGHIPGAFPISYKDIVKPDNLAKLPKDKDIILYCNTGHDENKALTVLRMLGYKAYGLKWGYMSWHEAPPTDLTLKAIEESKSGKYPVEN